MARKISGILLGPDMTGGAEVSGLGTVRATLINTEAEANPDRFAVIQAFTEDDLSDDEVGEAILDAIEDFNDAHEIQDFEVRSIRDVHFILTGDGSVIEDPPTWDCGLATRMDCALSMNGINRLNIMFFDTSEVFDVESEPELEAD